MSKVSEISAYHENLIKTGLLRRGNRPSVWAQHFGDMSNINYPWKLHLYAKGYDDWYNLARVVIPYLVRENATFKTVNYNPHWVGNYPILENDSEQFGKAFTIYPNNQKEFEKLVLGLNEVISHANLHTDPELDEDYHNIAFEKTLGDTGRIFYRVERDKQGEYIDAKEARKKNPTNPYNPFGFPDPFANLLPSSNAPKKQHAQQKKSTADAFWHEVKKIADSESMGRSSDGKGASVYFSPRSEKDIIALESVLKKFNLKYDVHYSNMFGKNVLRVLNQELDKLYAGPQPQHQEPQAAQQKVNTGSGSFLDALYKIGTTEKILKSSDGKGGSVYFYPHDAKDMATLESLLRAAGMKYDIHYSSMLNKNVLRVSNKDLTVQIPDKPRNAPQQKDAGKFKSGEKNIQKKNKEKSFIEMLKEAFGRRG